MGKQKKKSFEESLKRLQEISDLLEDENVGLDKSISLYEEGIMLAKNCYNILKDAEVKVTNLKKDFDSELENSDSLTE